jgi:hypothetical protein
MQYAARVKEITPFQRFSTPQMRRFWNGPSQKTMKFIPPQDIGPSSFDIFDRPLGEWTLHTWDPAPQGQNPLKPTSEPWIQVTSVPRYNGIASVKASRSANHSFLVPEETWQGVRSRRTGRASMVKKAQFLAASKLYHNLLHKAHSGMRTITTTGTMIGKIRRSTGIERWIHRKVAVKLDAPKGGWQS